MEMAKQEGGNCFSGQVTNRKFDNKRPTTEVQYSSPRFFVVDFLRNNNLKYALIDLY